jgi:glycosyltransferase involved in cell wall biosynthesis
VACAGLRCEHDGNILIAGDASSFAASVIELLNDPARREQLGAAGRQVAEKFYGWDASARQLQTLYEQYSGLRGTTPVTVHEGVEATPESRTCNPVR